MTKKPQRIKSRAAKKSAKLWQKITTWHYRIGIIASAFILLIAITGILLNHTAWFGLNKTYIHSDLLANWYGLISVNGHEMQKTMTEIYKNEGISLNKLVLDLHTGKILAIPGKIFTDLVAIILIFLLTTGIYTWYKKRGGRRKKQ